MKTSFLFSIAAGIMLVSRCTWCGLCSPRGCSTRSTRSWSVVSTPGDTTPFRVQDYVNTQKVMGVSALIACVDVVIFTALATLGSFLYNLAATMLGGLEITSPRTDPPHSGPIDPRDPGASHPLCETGPGFSAATRSRAPGPARRHPCAWWSSKRASAFHRPVPQLHLLLLGGHCVRQALEDPAGDPAATSQ